MPRIRKTDSRVPSRVDIKDYNPGSSTPASSSVVATPSRYSSGKLKVITDIPDSKYFTRRKKGEVVLNGVQILSSDIKSTIGHWQVGPHAVWGTRTIDGSCAAEAHVDIATKLPAYYLNDVSNAKSRALVEAYAKMKSPDVLLPVFWYEREKTLRMARRPFGNAIRLLDDIFARRARFLSRGYSLVQAIESAWLEARYGWRPTMYDLWGIAKAAAHKKPLVGSRLVARGGEYHAWKRTEVSTGTFGGPCDRTWSIKTKIGAGVVYSVDDMTEAGWKRRCLGLTLDNVPSNIWEVIPFSFVVDWFYQVGLWLRAATPDPSIAILGNWISTVDDIEQETVMLPVTGTISIPPSPDVTYSLYGGDSYHQTDRNLNRECGIPLAPGPLKVETPLSFSNLLDGLFLLHGSVVGKLSKLHRL